MSGQDIDTGLMDSCVDVATVRLGPNSDKANGYRDHPKPYAAGRKG